MAKAAPKKPAVDRTKDYIKVNDRDGKHEEDVEISAETAIKIWNAISQFVDLSAASGIMAVIIAPPAPEKKPS